MGNRLSKVITKTGDKGTTGLGDGSRVLKSCKRIEAIGEFDELNCHIGISLTLITNETQSLLVHLNWIQHKIFDAGGELAMPGYTFIKEADVHYLEDLASQLNENLKPLKEFILPGGHPFVAQIHLVRAVTRRLERVINALNHENPEVKEMINPFILQFINRLSDVFFIMARNAAKLTATAEVLWKNLNQKP